MGSLLKYTRQPLTRSVGLYTLVFLLRAFESRSVHLPGDTESIYWYDFETTGIDSIADRPLQVAGIRTDHDLNELDDSALNLFCRPGNDVVPDPDALLVTGILMSEVLQQGLGEWEFTRKLLAEFSQPNTCVAGFNNLRFDDEFMRQLLYRNFHDPYAREWRNGNSRWDVIDLFRAAYALRPDGFNWPKKPDGNPSFRLEDLARANDIPHVDAHDALADVRTTIAVTRMLKSAQPRLFQFSFGLRDKRAVLAQLYPLGKAPVVHVSSMYPASRHCLAVVAPLCQHPTNNNSIICFDLAQSPEALTTLNPSELAERLFTKSDQLKPGEDRIALKTIQINKSPFVAPIATLTDAICEKLELNLAQATDRMRQINSSPGIVEKLHEVFSQRQFDESEDPDDQLYNGGFASDTDRSVMAEVLASSKENLSALTGRFQDARYDEMLFRYRGRNFPETLSVEELTRWNDYRSSRWSTGRHPNDVLADVEQRLATDLPTSSVQVLQDLKAYLESLS